MPTDLLRSEFVPQQIRQMERGRCRQTPLRAMTLVLRQA
jgi:hypothetical protein